MTKLKIRTTDDGFLIRLRQYLAYDKETGQFSWAKYRSGVKSVGGKAGYVNKSNGRLYIKFEGFEWQAHRLAWLLTYGKWPSQLIDHIDGNPLNNKISNLRDVSHAVNQQNQKKAQSNNKLGLMGVSLHKGTGKFCSVIYVDKKQKYLGLYKTPEEAHAAYLAAKRKNHEGFVAEALE